MEVGRMAERKGFERVYCEPYPWDDSAPTDHIEEDDGPLMMHPAEALSSSAEEDYEKSFLARAAAEYMADTPLDQVSRVKRRLVRVV